MNACAVNVNPKCVEFWTENPPSFSYKINKLSDDLYESPCFSSGGYNWILGIYPHGDEVARGYISMYVKIDSTSLTSTPPSEVFAYLTFFIYNKKENKYWTIRGLEMTRFDANSLARGVKNALLSIFEEEECEFGVDVMVVSPFTELETTLFIERLSFPKFSWNVKNFSELNEDSYSSNIFSMGGREWTLKLYPMGDSVKVGQWLSLFLYLVAEDESLTADGKIYVEANLRVLDPRGSNHKTEKIDNWYTESDDVWGYDEFMLLSELRGDYLDMEGSLNVEVEFEVVKSTKYSSII